MSSQTPYHPYEMTKKLYTQTVLSKFIPNLEQRRKTYLSLTFCHIFFHTENSVARFFADWRLLIADEEPACSKSFLINPFLTSDFLSQNKTQSF